MRGERKHTGHLEARRPTAAGVYTVARQSAIWRLDVVGTFSHHAGPGVLPTGAWPAAPPSRPVAHAASPKLLYNLGVGL